MTPHHIVKKVTTLMLEATKGNLMAGLVYNHLLSGMNTATALELGRLFKVSEEHLDNSATYNKDIIGMYSCKEVKVIT
jgi:hypothetical protein